MPVEVFTNDGLGTVTSGGTTAPSPGTIQTWTVTVTNNFPAASSSATPTTQFFVCDQLTLNETEKILVTNISGSTWTVTRGADGSTPVAHIAGFTIVQVVAGASLRALQQPWQVPPSGDTTGATDPVNVQAAITAYGQAVLVAGGVYYGNATVTGHEGQWVHCLPGVTWNMKTTGIPGFQWTMANTASYSLLGTGGITGRPQIVGPAGAAFGSSNPTDGSIGVLMGDVVQLQADAVVTNCQWGLLLQNQYFWTEQGTHRIVSHGCTNPVVLQCAASGGASRTTSFERCDITVYHAETMSGSFGHGGVQLLAGALLDGGAIRQYGNFGGTGQSSVYALYVSGQAPVSSASTNFSTVGAGTNASLDTQVIHHVEYNGTGTGPNSIFVDTSCSVTAWGALEYAWAGWGTAPVVTGTFAFSGPISDTVLAGKGWTKVTTGFPSGWSGTVAYRLSGNNGMVDLSFALSIAASTAITEPTTIATLPSGFYWASDNKFIQATYNASGGTSAAVTLRVNSSGLFSWVGGAITTPAGGASTIYGQATYPVVV